jgi:hypothetical protein
MTSLTRSVLSVAALALALGAAPARAACGRVCDEMEDMGGSAVDEPARLQAVRPHRSPAVEMTLPGYLWSKLRAGAHDYADKAAYALITATSKLAIAAAHEKQAQENAAPAPAPKPAPAAKPVVAPKPPGHSECSSKRAA